MAVIVLSDAGCGTSVKNTEYTNTGDVHDCKYWNLQTVLQCTINPGGKLPCLVMTSHCHFDHILGIGVLPPTDSDPRHGDVSERQGPPTTVLSSAFDKDYIHPWEHLCCHSLVKAFDAVCPYYSIGIWAEDNDHVVYSPDGTHRPIPTGIIVMQTPGHTPDSLAWYDADSHFLSVGDSFYEVSSHDTLHNKWGAEPRGPIMFEEKSDLAAWWKSLDKVLQFTRRKNAELADQHAGPGPTPRVCISASHVTTCSPDAEPFLLSIKAFMSRVLRAEVPEEKIEAGWLPFNDLRGWDDGAEAGQTKDFEWIVWAPNRIIEEGRHRIPKAEWSSSDLPVIANILLDNL